MARTGLKKHKAQTHDNLSSDASLSDQPDKEAGYHTAVLHPKMVAPG